MVSVVENGKLVVFDSVEEFIEYDKLNSTSKSEIPRSQSLFKDHSMFKSDNPYQE